MNAPNNIIKQKTELPGAIKKSAIIIKNFIHFSFLIHDRSNKQKISKDLYIN